MLDRLRKRLEPTDGLERHILAARLLGSPRTIVDVGGISGQLAPHLANGAAVTAVNVDQPADVVIEPGPHPLPFRDRAFEASVSLDTLEHIPRPDRPLFVRELLRLAERRTVLCCPLGGELRGEIERSDNAWYRALTGREHPWISEHLEHGPPTLPELEELFGDAGARFYFSGDVRATSRQFRMAERSQVARDARAMARWVAFRLSHGPDLELSERAAPTTNRVFAVVEFG